MAIGVLVVSTTSGCGQILGVDEYRVGEPPFQNPCGPLQVWTGTTCSQNLGVPDGECGDGFQSDKKGGCDPNLRDTVCPPGQFAGPGSVGCLAIVPCGQNGRRDPAPDPRNSYVRGGAVDGNGTLEAPFGTIEEALKALMARTPTPGFLPTINIADGDGPYAVNLDVTFLVYLQGNCPDQTLLVAKDPTKPVVTFRPDATGSNLAALGIEGGSLGVLVDGADAVLVGNVRITALDGPGVVANDAEPIAGAPSAGITVNLGARNSPVVIDGTLGAGVLSYGANLALESVLVRRTRDPGLGKDAGGVCVRPSPWVPTLAERDVLPPGAWDPRRVVRPRVTMIRTLLEDNAGSGLSVIGADATVSSSLVRATGTSDVPEQSVGIDVAEHPFGDVLATLTLTQSVVEGARVEGIRSRNATLMIENTVVRDIGGTSPSSPGATRCLGSGVRFRWDRPADLLESGDPAVQTPALIMKTSLVERTRDTGILVEGAAARIESSIVGDTAKDPCASAAT